MSDGKPNILDSAESELTKSNSAESSSSKPPAKQKPGAKPRASRAGTRSVASLNAEQLARKRANDREAQRAIRQRQKVHITNLERRINELSGDQTSGQSREEVLRRNSELEEELRQLRAALYGPESSSAEHQISSSGYGAQRSASYPNPWLSPHEGEGPPEFGPPPAPISSAVSSWPPGPSAYVASNPRSTIGPPVAATAIIDEFNAGIDPLDTSAVTGQPIPVPLEQGDTAYNSLASQLARRIPVRGGSPYNNRPGNVWRPRLHPSSTVSTYGEPVAVGSSTIPPRSQPMGYHIPTSFANQPSLHMWELPLRFMPPQGPAENILNAVVQYQRNMAVSGMVGVSLRGPLRPSVKTFFKPQHPSHPIVYILSNLVRASTYRSLPEQLGTFFVLYPLFQWQVTHSYETYTNLPEWYRPTAAQLSIPHPSWVSYLGWPGMRDVVIKDQARYANVEFQYLYVAHINVHWPYPTEATLVFEGEELRVTDTFLNHVMDLRNWTLDDPFANRYPELRNVCNFYNGLRGSISGVEPRRTLIIT